MVQFFNLMGSNSSLTKGQPTIVLKSRNVSKRGGGSTRKRRRLNDTGLRVGQGRQERKMVCSHVNLAYPKNWKGFCEPHRE